MSDRTSELRKKGFEGRRLGPKQMTTDTAVRVTRMVVQEKGLFAFLLPDRVLRGLHSCARQGAICGLPRAEIQQTREYRDALPLCHKCAGRTNLAPGKYSVWPWGPRWLTFYISGHERAHPEGRR